MKVISLSLLLAICAVFTGFSQQQKVSGKAVIKTPTVLCDVCKERLEFFISHEAGVTSVKVNIRQKTTTVTWLNDRTTLENIKVAIANLGYDADDIEAEEGSFKRLPKDCRLHKDTLKPKAPEVKQ